MPLAPRTGVTVEGAWPVHARKPGSNVAICAPLVKELGDVSNAVFDPAHPDSCRICAHHLTASETSYHDWLRGQLSTLTQRMAFDAAFEALVEDRAQCAEDTAFNMAQRFGGMARQQNRERAVQAAKSKAETQRRRGHVALGLKPVGREASCSRCGETFCPADDDDLIHAQRLDGSECGGSGRLAGSWR